MTKLEELIEQLCPDGVEYKTLGEIATDIYRGSGIKRDQIRKTGTPCVRYGEIYTTYGIFFDSCVSYTDESLLTTKKYFEYGDILFAITGESVEDIAKSCAYVGHEKCLAGGDIVVLKHNEDPKYLSYALATADARKQKSFGKSKNKVVHSSVPAIKSIKLPVPPLEVQREIVRILDNFTFLSTELAAELAARQKQYEYYRDSLLDSSTETIVSLKDVAKYGKNRIDATYMTEDNYVSVENLLQNKKGKCKAASVPVSGNVISFEKNDILIGNIRPYLKKIWLSNTAGGTNGDVLVIKTTSGKTLSKYLYYVLSSDSFFAYDNSHAKGGKMPRGSKDAVMDYEFKLPPLEVQQRIVDILDRFDTLCNDISNGLPAEIEMRQKQYEYYRDKLLTFKELKKEA